MPQGGGQEDLALDGLSPMSLVPDSSTRVPGHLLGGFLSRVRRSNGRLGDETGMSNTALA